MGHNTGTQDKEQELRKIHLTKRGSRYFFRRRVPDELRPLLGRNEIKKALGTSDFSEAKRRAAIETVRTDELFLKSRSDLMQQVAPKKERRRVTFQEAIPLVAGWIEEMERLSVDWAEENFDIHTRPDDLQEALYEAREREHVLSGGGGSYTGNDCRASVRRHLEEAGMQFDGSPEEFNRLAGLFRRASLDNARHDRAFLDGSEDYREPTIAPSVPLQSIFQHGAIPSRKVTTVGQILDEYRSELNEKIAEGNRSKATGIRQFRPRGV